MSKVVGAVIGIAFTVVGGIIGGPIGAAIGSMIGSLVSRAILPKGAGKNRAAASAAQVQIGEVPREGLVGEGSTAGSLVDAFNYGGKYGTDWEVMVLDLFDHRCSALVGFYVNDSYVAFGGDGVVAGYNNQLQVYWRPGTESQTVPAILTANGPGWTANDNGAGVCYVVVAYKADEADAKNPVWPGGRPRFQWVVRGALCYDPRKDSTVGGSGAHRIDTPATWEYSDNPIVTRYKWVRGFYACDRVGQQDQLLIGRGLSAVEAPPANVFARANLCDEIVGGEKRYRVGGAISAAEAFIEVEEDFAAACAGTIVQPQGCVEIDPGEARAVVATFTDSDLIVGSRVRWNNGILSTSSDEWINTVIATYIDPAQKWSEHAAPVRRDTADIAADRQPRERKLLLGFVTWVKQAQRCAEVVRRLGRLPGRGEVTLPPRFCEIEEGDWVQWQSDRRFGGGTRTFQVLSWGSNEKWHHTIQFRQISASVYSDTAPLDDGSIAAPSPVPPTIGAPAIGAWTATASHLDTGGSTTPALIVTGANDDPAARFVRVEYVQSNAAPTPATVWNDVGVAGPDVTRREITVAPLSTYYVAVSYIVDGVLGDRRVLGPLTTGPSLGTGKLFIRATAPTAAESTGGDDWQDADGRYWERRGDNHLSIGGKRLMLGGKLLTITWTPNASQPVRTIAEAAAAAQQVADAATVSATAANAALADIANDGLLTPGEKPDVSLNVQTITSEQAGIDAQATAYGITTEKTAYDNAVSALTTYLATLTTPVGWNILTGNTTIDGPTFRAKFADVYDKRQILLNKIAEKAGTTAVWGGVGGAGKPEDNADVTSQITGQAEINIAANSAGTPTVPLPVTAQFTLIRNGTDVTATATWSVTVLSGTIAASFPSPGSLSLNSSGGVLSSATLRLTAVYGSTTRNMDVRVTRNDAAPPSGGGSGGGGSSSFSATSSSTSPTALSPELSLTVGASGNVDLTAGYSFSVSGSVVNARLFTQWYEWNGSAYVAISGTAKESDDGYSTFIGEPASGTNSRQITGLTPSATKKFRLYGYNSGGSTGSARYVNGTVGAASS